MPRTYNRARIISSTNGVGKTRYPHAKILYFVSLFLGMKISKSILQDSIRTEHGRLPPPLEYFVKSSLPIPWDIIGWKETSNLFKTMFVFSFYGSLTFTVTNTPAHFIYIAIWWTNFCTSLISAFCFFIFKHVHVSRVLCSTHLSGFTREFQFSFHFPLNINPCNWLKTHFLTPVQMFASAPGGPSSSLST